ncbi:FecR family protein [Acinetobacter larvae]|uniref:FecR family protein n=1 Tax=Acinetobacter larvae TaxID=1789224 RepID=UPI0012FD6343|nr:FecR domain-containing protein [Acinetobacter larvae]
MNKHASEQQPQLDHVQDALIVEMISDWLIQIHGEQGQARQQAEHAYQQWKLQHPDDVHIAEKIEESFAQMLLLQQQSIAHKKIMQPLFQNAHKNNKTGKGRQRIKYGVFALLGMLPIALYLQQNSPGYLLADIHSNTGEWRTEILADGTQITLKNKTAFNVDYSKQQRVIQLIQGDILVHVAADPTRPFSVQVEQGSIRALGTQFSVHYAADHTDLIMLESKVLLRSNTQQLDQNRLQQKQLIVGQRAYLTASGIQTLPNVDVENIRYQWNKQTLVAEERPLLDVLAELDQHHRGKIYYDRKKMAKIRVTAVVPLNHSANAMQLLQQALPQLTVKHIANYVYWVDIANPDTTATQN